MGKISFSFSKGIEGLLIVLMVFALFLFDINGNKLIDKGMDYEVTLFSNLTIKSIVLFWIALFATLIIFISILARAINRKSTFYKYDVIFGIITGIGIFIMLSGGIVELLAQNIPFFAGVIKTITYKHIGVGIILLGTSWFGLTD